MITRKMSLTFVSKVVLIVIGSTLDPRLDVRGVGWIVLTLS